MKAWTGGTVAVLLALCATAGWAVQGPVRDAACIEADWVKQAREQRTVTTQADALGACDGIKDGKWAFHTDIQEEPWWQVDLGAQAALDHALIFNRCDGAASRAGQLTVLLSDDGKAWRQVYQHNGTVFYGTSDGKPLRVALKGEAARYLRVQLPGRQYLHLDEVEVYGAADPSRNLALWAAADQCSISQWSVAHLPPAAQDVYPLAATVDRGRKLVADLKEAGVDTAACAAELDEVERQVGKLGHDTGPTARTLYFRARWAIRTLAFANPLLDFDDLVFCRRAPSQYSHMSDQHYGWWSRPGGGLCILEGFRTDTPRLRCLTESLPEGSVEGPDLSFDGRRILFAYSRYYPHLAGLRDKTDKAKIPQDAFYHIYEVGVDGSGLRQLTSGAYDDFDPRHLPGGGIAFLSTRRGQFVQTTPQTALTTLDRVLPDSFVRCGGDQYRPVAVYTLHRMDSDGGNVRALSPFENFEWTPSVADDGRILYARWDYVDRDNMPYMSLWSTNPDGTNARIVYGNFTRSPHCIFEARQVPGSQKLVFTASGHHAITGGSLVLLDPPLGVDGPEPLTRLTPEVCFPEIEGWPGTFYANPYPLSERYFLAAWSDQPVRAQGSLASVNGLGLYLVDAFGNRELIYRDPDLGAAYPLPLRPRIVPTQLQTAPPEGPSEGRFVLLNVYAGLTGIAPGTIKALRIVHVPPKTQPNMNTPVLGVTRDDPGKCVLGTVPVEADGSAHFRAPAGTGVFFQALDGHGFAVQTMRSLTYLQPGEALSCIGCHEPRNSVPSNQRAQATGREASKLKVGPEGSWPLRFDRLVQPVLDDYCVRCHNPDGHGHAAQVDLTAEKAWETLVSSCDPSIRDLVLGDYRAGKSTAGAGIARRSDLIARLTDPDGHHGVRLPNEELQRIILWADLYGQRLGAFSDEQERRLIEFRGQIKDMLEE